VPKSGKGKGKKKAAATEPPREDFAPEVAIGVPPLAVPSMSLSADPGLPPASSEAFMPLSAQGAFGQPAVPVQQGQFAPFADPEVEHQLIAEPVPEPDIPDPRDVFWSNVNSAMHHGVHEVPSTGALPPAGTGARAGTGAPGPSGAEGELAASTQPAQSGAAKSVQPQAPLVDPAEFYPDGVTVPGPMSVQVARQFPPCSLGERLSPRRWCRLEVPV
jgi:hypothetical protein